MVTQKLVFQRSVDISMKVEVRLVLHKYTIGVGGALVLLVRVDIVGVSLPSVGGLKSHFFLKNLAKRRISFLLNN